MNRINQSVKKQAMNQFLKLDMHHTSSHFNFFEKHPILSAYRYYCTVLVVNTVVSLRSESTLCSVQEEYIYMSGGVRAERDEITSRDEKNFQDT